MWKREARADEDAEALRFVQSVMSRAEDSAGTDPEHRLPLRPVYKYRRDFADVGAAPSAKEAIRLADARRRHAQGGKTDGSPGSQRIRAVASPGAPPPPDLTPWEARTRRSFQLPSIEKLVSSERRQRASAQRSESRSTPPRAGGTPPRQRKLRQSPSTRTPIPVSPRTYEYLRATPTPETSVGVVEMLSRVVTSNSRVLWERANGPHNKTAKEVAADRRAMTLALLEAVARGGREPPAAEQLAACRDGFDCLAAGGATLSVEALLAHMARAGLAPCRRAAALRRGQVTFDQLIGIVFDHSSSGNGSEQQQGPV